jgi:hypothetical protein
MFFVPSFTDYFCWECWGKALFVRRTSSPFLFTKELRFKKVYLFAKGIGFQKNGRG